MSTGRCTEPEFIHDCEECIFLGRLANIETLLVTDEVLAALEAAADDPMTIADLNKLLGVKPAEFYDLYVCNGMNAALGPSIIARWGDEGPQYKSLPWIHAEADDELRKGLDLALKAGLIPKCGVKGDEDGD